jgi:hypothetical protein
MKIKASFTIEAVFVMPVVLFTIIFIIYLSFCLHDYCKIRGLTDVALLKASMNLKHDAEITGGRVNLDKLNDGLISSLLGKKDIKEQQIESHIRNLLSKGLIVTKITDVNVTMGVYDLSVRVEGYIKAPLKSLLWLISPDNTLVVEAKTTSHYPADTVRISEVILDTGSKIKGSDKLKESIGKLIPNQ